MLMSAVPLHVKVFLQWRWGQNRPPRGPRQDLGPYSRAYEPTSHLRDTECEDLVQNKLVSALEINCIWGEPLKSF